MPPARAGRRSSQLRAELRQRPCPPSKGGSPECYEPAKSQPAEPRARAQRRESSRKTQSEAASKAASKKHTPCKPQLRHTSTSLWKTAKQKPPANALATKALATPRKPAFRGTQGKSHWQMHSPRKPQPREDAYRSRLACPTTRTTTADPADIRLRLAREPDRFQVEAVMAGELTRAVTRRGTDSHHGP